MSYLKCLKIINLNYPNLFDNLSENDLIRIEKTLKLESKINQELDINSVKIFLESLKNNKSELVYILNSTRIIEVISNDIWQIKKHKTEVTDTHLDIKFFLTEYLLNELLLFCENCLKNEWYDQIDKLLYYKNFLPDEVILLIEKRITIKLDHIVNNLKKGYFRAVINNRPKVLDFAKTLPKLSERVHSIDIMAMRQELKVTNKLGIVVFFETLFNGFYFLGLNPTSIEEKEERKYAIREMNVILCVLGFLGIILSIGVYYGMKRDNERKEAQSVKRQEAFSKSIYGYMTVFDTLKTKNVKLIDTVKTGDDFFGVSEGKKRHFKTTPYQVKNNSSYDVIIFPKSFSDPYNQISLSYFLKAKDSIVIAHPIVSLYIGKQLAFFDANEKKSFPKTPRFLLPHPKTQKTIGMYIEGYRGFEISEKDKKLRLHNKEGFSIDGSRYVEFEIK